MTKFKQKKLRGGVLYIFIIFVNITWLSSCDYFDYKFTLTNKTNDTIYYIDSENKYFRYLPLRFNNIDTNELLYSQEILPMANTTISTMGNWEDKINSNKDSSIYIFFFKKDLVKKYSKDSTLLKKQLYSKKVKLKVKDLEKLNWNVTYP